MAWYDNVSGGGLPNNIMGGGGNVLGNAWSGISKGLGNLWTGGGGGGGMDPGNWASKNQAGIQEVWNQRPDYNPIFNYNYESVTPGMDFTKSVQDVDKLRNYAFSTENSPWLNAAIKQQGLEEAQGLDQAALGAAGAARQATQQASMYGMGSGTAERLANNAAQNKFLAQQGVRAQGAMTRAGLGAQDWQNKLALQQKLPGMELEQDKYTSDLEHWNLDAKMKNAMAENQFNLGRWSQLGAMQGAGMTSQAQMAAANQPGGFLSNIFGGIL